MTKIYIVYQNYQTTDSDGWQHWMASEDKSYHATVESAERAVKALLAKDLAEFKSYPGYEPALEYMSNRVKALEANLQHFSDGAGSSISLEEECIYGIRPVVLQA